MTQSPDSYPDAPPVSERYGGPVLRGGAALAGRWRRLFAGIVDGLVILVVGWPIGAATFGRHAFTGPTFSGDRLGANAVVAVIGVLYFAFMHGTWGQSIGKIALGLRVVRVADSGPIGYGAAFGRAAFTYALSIVTADFFSLVDGLFVLWDPRKQSLHDKIVKTAVVNAFGPDPYARAQGYARDAEW